MALREMVKSGEYQRALDYIENSSFYQNKNEQLLKLLEVAMLHHLQGQYFQSTQVLNRAISLDRELFTVSLSNRAQIYVIGDGQDIYYARDYERSTMHFYKALGHFMLWQQGYYESHKSVDSHGNTYKIEKRKLSERERREELFRARAELLNWNAFSRSLEQSAADGELIFSRDMMAYVFGSLVHQAIGQREDLEIALNLMGQARGLVRQQYAFFSAFNKEYQSLLTLYRDNKIEQLSRDQDLLARHIRLQDSADQLEIFIYRRYLTLLYRVRGPRSFRQELRVMAQENRFEQYLDQWREEIPRLIAGEYYPLSVLIEDSLVSQKQGREIFFGLSRSLEDPETRGGANIAAAALTIFAVEVLNLMPPANQYNPAGAHFGFLAAEVAAREAAIAFEVPEIELRPANRVARYQLRVWSAPKEERLADHLVAEQNLKLTQPFSDIAALNVALEARGRYFRQGPRIAMKHAAAIAASYLTYRSLRGGDDGGAAARAIALLQYTAASRAIAASERADTRYWSTLPSDLMLTELYLPAGKYYLELTKRDHKGSTKRKLELGMISHGPNSANNLINMRVP